MNFQAFREHVIQPAGVRILAFLNISAIGMVSVGAAGVAFAENDDDRLLDVASAIEVIEKNHIYYGGADSLLDGQGHVREVFREAKARGVTFDVGLHRIHTSVAVVRAALAEWTCPPRSRNLSPWGCRWSRPSQRPAIRRR